MPVSAGEESQLSPAAASSAATTAPHLPSSLIPQVQFFNENNEQVPELAIPVSFLPFPISFITQIVFSDMYIHTVAPVLSGSVIICGQVNVPYFI